MRLHPWHLYRTYAHTVGAYCIVCYLSTLDVWLFNDSSSQGCVIAALPFSLLLFSFSLSSNLFLHFCWQVFSIILPLTHFNYACWLFPSQLDSSFSHGPRLPASPYCVVPSVLLFLFSWVTAPLFPLTQTLTGGKHLKIHSAITRAKYLEQLHRELLRRTVRFIHSQPDAAHYYKCTIYPFPLTL